MNPDLQDWMYSLQEAQKAGDQEEVQRALAHIKSLNSAANQADFQEAETPELNTGVANSIAGIGDAVIDPVQALVDRGIESAQQPEAGYSPPWARPIPEGDAGELLAGAFKVPGAIARGAWDMAKAPFQAKTGREFMKSATDIGLAVEGARVPLKALARNVPAVGRTGAVMSEAFKQSMPFKGRVAAVVNAGRSPLGRVRAEIIAEAKQLGTRLDPAEINTLAEAKLAQREGAFTAPLRRTPSNAPMTSEVRPSQGSFPPIEGTGSGRSTAGMSAGEARMQGGDRLQKIKPREIASPYSTKLPVPVEPPQQAIPGRATPTPGDMAAFTEELAAKEAAKAAARAEDFAHRPGPGMGRSPAEHRIAPPADAMERSAAYYRNLEKQPIGSRDKMAEAMADVSVGRQSAGAKVGRDPASVPDASRGPKGGARYTNTPAESAAITADKVASVAGKTDDELRAIVLSGMSEDDILRAASAELKRRSYTVEFANPPQPKAQRYRVLSRDANGRMKDFELVDGDATAGG